MSEAGHRDVQEIIIVRRRGSHHDEHHGGVWKIAFADFMTAMMAFFLVMWLTNTTDDSTREQIAQYFNPIKLTDSAPSSKGISDKESTDTWSRTTGQMEEAIDAPVGGRPMAGEEDSGEEQKLFRDPYAVLAEIAAQSTSTAGSQELGNPDGSGLPGLNGGDAYRDPFDPQSWQLSPNTTEAGGDLDTLPPPEFKTAVLPPEGEAAELQPVGGEIAARSEAQEVGEDDASEDDVSPEASDEAEIHAEQLKEDIESELSGLAGAVPSNVEVSEGEGGLVISLADDFDSGMFSVGSAKPNADAIAMMEKIANVLKTRNGKLVIRGHTDSRPFNDENYDNWRLSTARAHMAYYMLMRGGLAEDRVQAIEGFADREPKDAADPEAAVNRRIEILLLEEA